MAIEYDRERVKLERDYSAEQNELNRAHVERMKDKEIELEKWKFEREKYLRPIREVLKFPVRFILFIPLIVSVIRKHKAEKILELMK